MYLCMHECMLVGRIDSTNTNIHTYIIFIFRCAHHWQLIKTKCCTYWLFDEESLILRFVVHWPLYCINSIRKCKKPRPQSESQCHIVSDFNK